MMTRTERFAEYLKSILPSLAVSAAIWLVLQSAACMGFRSFFLRPFFFFTGALAGINGGTMIGGAIGRAVIFVFFEQIIWTLLFSKKPAKDRLKEAGRLLMKKLAHVIPYCKEIGELVTKDYLMLGIECIGAGTAVILSYVLSGNGAYLNSFVSVALFITVTEELQTHSGLIFHACKKLTSILREDLTVNFLKAHALGYVLGFLLKGRTVMLVSGGLFILAGIILIFLAKKK